MLWVQEGVGDGQEWEGGGVVNSGAVWDTTPPTSARSRTTSVRDSARSVASGFSNTASSTGRSFRSSFGANGSLPSKLSPRPFQVA